MIDMIFATRQRQEKCQEQHRDLYTTFVDLTKAFDTVSRDSLWKIMAKLWQSLVHHRHNSVTGPQQQTTPRTNMEKMDQRAYKIKVLETMLSDAISKKDSEEGDECYFKINFEFSLFDKLHSDYMSVVTNVKDKNLAQELSREISCLSCRDKFIALVRPFHDVMQVCVQDDGKPTELILIINKVKQGCILASTLFCRMFSAMLAENL